MRTKRSSEGIRNAVGLGILGLTLAIGSAARADDAVSVTTSSPEKKTGLYNAFEVGLGAGYSQGVGDVGAGIPSLTNSGGPGASVELDLGWRFRPNWLVGVYSTASWLSSGDQPGNAHNNWTASAGVQANYHFQPGEGFDPWIGLGAGGRGYWVNRPGGTDVRYGLDVGRVQVGLDVPVAAGVTVSPFIGATATVLLTQELAQQNSFTNISSPNVNVFLNAGVLGRFDLLGADSPRGASL